MGSFGETASRTQLASFGEKPSGQGIDAFRNSTHHNGPMGSFGETASRTQLVSFGEKPSGQGIDAFRNSTHHIGSMGSFGKTVSWRDLPVFSTHYPEIAIGFVWQDGRWLALKIGGHTTAIMQSGPRPFSWDRATLRGHDDSFGEGELASFGESPRAGAMTISELNTSELVLASFGKTAPGPPIGFVWGRPPIRLK